MTIKCASFLLFPWSLFNICDDALNKYSSEPYSYRRKEHTQIFMQKRCNRWSVKNVPIFLYEEANIPQEILLEIKTDQVLTVKIYKCTKALLPRANMKILIFNSITIFEILDKL